MLVERITAERLTGVVDAHELREVQSTTAANNQVGVHVDSRTSPPFAAFIGYDLRIPGWAALERNVSCWTLRGDAEPGRRLPQG